MLFIDTWGWIWLFNRRERRHSDIREHYQNARKQGEEIFTTDYVLQAIRIFSMWEWTSFCAHEC